MDTLPSVSSGVKSFSLNELMLLKCELMLLKCQINTSTNKNGLLLPTKCLECALKYSYFVSTTYFILAIS